MTKIDWLVLAIMWTVMFAWLLLLARIAVWFLFGGDVV